MLSFAFEVSTRHLIIRLGRFEFYVQREEGPSPYRVIREPGCVAVDLPCASIYFSNHKQAVPLSH